MNSLDGILWGKKHCIIWFAVSKQSDELEYEISLSILFIKLKPLTLFSEKLNNNIFTSWQYIKAVHDVVFITIDIK